MLKLLLTWLREKPLPTGARCGGPQPEEKAYLRSLAVGVCHHPGCHRARADFTCAFTQMSAHLGCPQHARPQGVGALYPGSEAQPGGNKAIQSQAQAGSLLPGLVLWTAPEPVYPM